MKAITVRNLPPEVARAIREKARNEGLSDLDKYAGLWTEEEAAEFEAFLKEQRSIDTEDWK